MLFLCCSERPELFSMVAPLCFIDPSGVYNGSGTCRGTTASEVLLSGLAQFAKRGKLDEWID